MLSPWQQLRKSQITLQEALSLLVDEQGNINITQLDKEVSHRFWRHFPCNKNLPPLIPLLLWQNCYYIGSPAELSPEAIAQLSDRTRTAIEVIPIEEKSYRNWFHIKQVDNGRLDPAKFVELFADDSGFTDLSSCLQLYLARTTSLTDQLNILIAGAIHHRRVSDIHLEPTHQGLKVRYRIDGILRDILQPDVGISPKLVTALKVKCNMDIAERRRPQDGRIRMTYPTGEDSEMEIDLRISTYPCVDGEKAVIRLLPQKNPFTSVEDLGFTQRALAIYNSWLQEPHGLIIITGPTGSGKTSTLYTSLQSVITEAHNVITIEDPVEYVLPGITQGQVNEAAGMTFATGLRAILRQDPDIIMVGEIRDAETAETAIKAAMTGHLVFTTLHTNDAISAISRLKGLGCDLCSLSDALLGIVAQRLLRRVCRYCARPHTPTVEDLEYLGLEQKQAQSGAWRQGRGCPVCYNSGYFGREAIIELLNVNQQVRQFIREGKMTEMYDYLSHTSFDSFRVAGIDKVLKGITTVAELKRTLPYNVIHPQV